MGWPATTAAGCVPTSIFLAMPALSGLERCGSAACRASGSTTTSTKASTMCIAALTHDCLLSAFTGHHEFPPYDKGQLHSIYHIRQFEAWQLSLVCGDSAGEL